jgi:hypothetical protein
MRMHLGSSARVAAFRWMAATVTAGLFCLAAACGSEAGLVGPEGSGTGSGGSGSDAGSLGGQDGVADVRIVGGDGGAGGGGGDAQANADGQLSPDGSTPPVDPQQSCQGKCGQAQPNQWPCQCDAQCAQYGDCCSDYKEVCSSGGGGGTTPTDPGQLVACLEKSCGKQIEQCTQATVCAAFWSCAKTCKDGACLEQCAQKQDMQQLAQVIQPLLQCGQQAGCLSGGGGPTPPQPSGPVCGDGKCEQPENSLNCKQDCPDTQPSAAQQCLNQKCNKQYEACFDDPKCVAAVACMNTGKQPQQCVSDQKTGQLLYAMLQCGQQQGCLSGGGQPAAVCGNGKCETGENASTCSADCKPVTPPTDPVTQCLADKCTNPYNTCQGNPNCVASVQCVLAGTPIQQCYKDAKSAQQAYQLLQCGQSNQCYSQSGGGGGGSGGGGGGGGTPGPGSCVGKCGQYIAGAACQCNAVCANFGNCCGDYQAVCGGGSGGGGGGSTASCVGKCGSFVPGAACQCNAECATFGNCCGDYKTVCSSTPPGPVCGDGVCTAPTESSANCAADCGAPPAKACKSKADCAATEICCGKSDGTFVCTPSGQCQ